MLYKLGYKLNTQVLKTLYFSFIYPQLLNGVEIYANKSSLQSLITLNNKIIRILQKKTILYAHCGTL